MANSFMQTAAPEHVINMRSVCSLVSDKYRAETKAALDDFEALQALTIDFAVPHLAEAARQKIEAAGVSTLDAATFRSYYLEGKNPEERLGQDMAQDAKFVARLHENLAPIFARIREAALAELSRAHDATRPTAAAYAARLGLPQSTAVCPLHEALGRALAELKATSSFMPRLDNIGGLQGRRQSVSAYFAKPL